MISVINLRCEYRKNPLGIDIKEPRIFWQINADSRNFTQSAYQIQVSKESPVFENCVWDTGKVSSNESIQIGYKGQLLDSFTRYFYRVRVWGTQGEESDWSEPAFWEMGQLVKDSWNAKWITPDCDRYNEEARPCSYLRKEFYTSKKIKKARAYITALGLYELRLNGRRAGDFLLTPGWTSYHNRVLYQTYDITEDIRLGGNALGIILADGWYRGHLTWKASTNTYGCRTAVFMEVHLNYDDGSEKIIITDDSWKSSIGPIVQSDIYMGESCDSNLEQHGWDNERFNDSRWQGVSLSNTPTSILVAQEDEPVRAIEEIKPISLITTPDGSRVLDYGQNMVGYTKFKVKGPKGSEVKLRHFEVLDGNGNPYFDNLRLAKQRIQYTLSANGEEQYEPKFTFMGFQYAVIETHPGEPSIDDFTGVVIHSDLEVNGSFECSDALVNQLQHNIMWSQKGNFVDIPTDCPQRSERLGWTGDAQIFIRTACFNMNSAAFFTKWLHDLMLDQKKSGLVPYIVPNVIPEDWEFMSRDPDQQTSAAWGDAAVICPWIIYLCYGDKKILEDQYHSMISWVEYIRNQSPDFIWRTGSQLGDWLALDAYEGSFLGSTPTEFIATVFFANAANIVYNAAEVLGKSGDVKEYKLLYENIIHAFREEYQYSDGSLNVATQTAHVLALEYNMLEEKDIGVNIGRLVEKIKSKNYHLDTGFVGTPYLCHVLSKYGYNDIAYTLLMQKDYPSWLYQVTKGATTIWEHWDGIMQDGSFWNSRMNSFNHYAYGSIGDWLYRVVAGIELDEKIPGYKHIVIKPQPDNRLTWARAEYESIYGNILSAWAIDDHVFCLKISIPANAMATVYLPNAKLNRVMESSQNLLDTEGILESREKSGVSIIKVGSGNYEFSYYLDIA